MIVRVAGSLLYYIDGGRLAETRHAFGLSLRQAADHLGVTAAAVCFWEHESVTPKLSHIQALQDLYGDALESMGAVVMEEM